MSGSFTLEGKIYSSGNVLVIAEIGTGHGGDMAKAKELVAAAAETGSDCAKFQCVFAEEIIHPATGSVALPGGSVALFDRFKSLELDIDFYAEIMAYTESRGLHFLCTPFGLKSARLLRRLGVAAMKVASPELNHLPLIDELASYGLPTILSSGVSSLGDIERAVRRFASPTALLHCVTSYPAPEVEYNLRLLKGLSSVLGLPVGVSDHSMDPLLVPTLSVAAGGCIVEKHICLSRRDPGLDDPIALEVEAFSAMVRSIRQAQASDAAAVLERLGSIYGSGKIEATLGDGVKRLAPSEAANYSRTNRSIHALRELRRGEVFSPEKLALLRTEKLLRPGLGPELLPVILGRVARRRIPSGEGVEWEDVGDIDKATPGKLF